jgi:hypothetical protein
MTSRSPRQHPSKTRVRIRAPKNKRTPRTARKGANRSFLAIFAVITILAAQKKRPPLPAESPALDRNRKEDDRVYRP